MESPRELDCKSVKSITLVVVDKRDWTVKLLSQIPPTLGKEVDAISVGDNPLKTGSELGCLAVITVLGKIIGQPFHHADTTDEEIYFTRADCSSEEISKLRKVNKLVEKILAKQKKLKTLAKHNQRSPTIRKNERD